MSGACTTLPPRDDEADALAVWQSRRLLVRGLLELLAKAEANNFGELDDHAHWGDVGTIELTAMKLISACHLACQGELQKLLNGLRLSLEDPRP